MHADREATQYLKGKVVLPAYELVGTAISVVQIQLRTEIGDLRMTCFESKLSACM